MCVFRSKEGLGGWVVLITTQALRSDSTAKTHDNIAGLFGLSVHCLTPAGAFGFGHCFPIQICPKPVWPEVAICSSTDANLLSTVADAFKTMFPNRLERCQ